MERWVPRFIWAWLIWETDFQMKAELKEEEGIPGLMEKKKVGNSEPPLSSWRGSATCIDVLWLSGPSP